MSTTEIVGDDTTLTLDTISAIITGTVMMDDGQTLACVWRYDPYYIDFYGKRLDSLFIVSQGVPTRHTTDTVRIYRNTSLVSQQHRILLQEFVPHKGPIIRVVDCNTSYTDGSAPVDVPAGRFESTYVATAFCPSDYFIIPDGPSGTVIRQRTFYFQPHVGMVRVRQSIDDSNTGMVRHTWSLLSYRIAAP